MYICINTQKKPHNHGTKTHKRGRGTKKTPVIGIVERNGKVKAKVQDKSKLKFKNMRKYLFYLQTYLTLIMIMP